MHSINKKGLSGVIVTVLIILVAIVAIVLIFTAIRPFLIKSSETSKIKSELLGTSLQVQEISVENESTINLIIKRNAGGGNVDGVIVVLEDINGNSKSFVYEEKLSELESKTFIVDYSNSGLAQINKITLSPLAKNSKGDKITGVSTVSVDYLAGSGNIDNTTNQCFSLWQCGDWSACSSGNLKTRICTDKNNCALIPSRNETSLCSNNNNLGCVINRVYWNTTQTTENTKVDLILEGNSLCENLDVRWDIKEDDLLGDDNVTNGAPNSKVIRKDNTWIAKATWTTEYQDDFSANPEYYIQAYIVQDLNISKNSENTLEVTKMQSANSLCTDSDGNETLPQNNEGFVLYGYQNCNDLANLSNEECGFVFSASDVCKNSNTLYEQTCNGDSFVTSEISCANGCLAGKCL